MNNPNEPITFNTNKDYEVPQMPPDSISQLCWNPQADILAAGSWSSEVRIWEVQRNVDRFHAVPKMAYTHSAPVLCVCQSPVRLFFMIIITKKIL